MLEILLKKTRAEQVTPGLIKKANSLSENDTSKNSKNVAFIYFKF